MSEDKKQSRLAPIDEDRRLIEEIIPIKEISIESAKEKTIRQGHISGIHLWWARRPLAASRAAVFSSLVKLSKSSKESLIESTKELCKLESANNKRIINKSRKIIEESFKNKPKVLDCFGGGGAIPLEASRLGCDSYSLELNPVAYIVELATLVYPQKYGKSKQKSYGGFETKQTSNKLVDAVSKWGDWIITRVEKELSQFFPKEGDSTVLNYLWARSIICSNPSCKMEIPLIKQYWLCRKKDRLIALKPVIKDNKVLFDVLEGSKIDFKPDVGTVKKGSAECICCGSTINREYIYGQACKGKMSKMMTAVVLTKKGSSKFYRKVTDKDLELYNKATEELNKYKAKSLNGIPIIPDEPLPKKGSLGISPYWSNTEVQKNTWSDLFNERQLLSMVTIVKYIDELKKLLDKEIQDKDFLKAIITYIAIALDKLADLNNSLCRWEPVAQCPRNLYNKQAIGMVWDYAESVPYSNASGSFQICLRNTLKGISSIPQDFMEPVTVNQGTATRQPFDEKYFDAVITDPPYYDAVPYSDISDLFYVWLKRTIGSLYPNIFHTVLTPKSNEIIQSTIRHEGDKNKAKQWYESEMTKAFSEANRVLKTNGIFVVVFAHKTTDAWETLVNGLLKANFVVTSSWPLQTENTSRVRAQNSAALASSIFIVCRKRKSEEDGYFNEIKIELEKKIKIKLDQFWSQGISGADFFISAIGPAVEVFGKYKKVLKLTGEEVSVAELLDLVRQIVTDYSLHRILKGKHMGQVDEDTNFYLLWRWAYNGLDVPYDDGRKLAQALGTEADELLSKKNLLEKKGVKVTLLHSWQRKKQQNLGEQKGGLPAPMIDVIHRACNLWEEGKKKELGEFLSEAGYSDNDTIWNVAQAISDVIPDGHKEKQVIQGLLVSRQSIEKDFAKKVQQGKLDSYIK